MFVKIGDAMPIVIIDPSEDVKKEAEVKMKELIEQAEETKEDQKEKN